MPRNCRAKARKLKPNLVPHVAIAPLLVDDINGVQMR
jgi:hypothetical protein